MLISLKQSCAFCLEFEPLHCISSWFFFLIRNHVNTVMTFFDPSFLFFSFCFSQKSFDDVLFLLKILSLINVIHQCHQRLSCISCKIPENTLVNNLSLQILLNIALIWLSYEQMKNWLNLFQAFSKYWIFILSRYEYFNLFTYFLQLASCLQHQSFVWNRLNRYRVSRTPLTLKKSLTTVTSRKNIKPNHGFKKINGTFSWADVLFNESLYKPILDLMLKKINYVLS